MNNQARARYLQIGAWSLSLLVSVLAFMAWGQSNAWQLKGISTYLLFPVFGLLAFSLMWAHYPASLIRQKFNLPKSVLHNYFEATGFAVLLFICLHPGLLIYQRFRDGFGLPPRSYESYVRPGLGWVTLVGTTSLFIFLAYELRRWYGQKPWWRYMQLATDVAMLGIFYHSLRLGTQLMSGWFKAVWWFYGITLVAILIYTYSNKYKAHQKSGTV